MSKANINVQFVHQSKYKHHPWPTPILQRWVCLVEGRGHSPTFEGVYSTLFVGCTLTSSVFGAVYWSSKIDNIFYRVPTGSGKPVKIKFSGKVMELRKIIKSHGKVMELRKSHTDKLSPSIRNLALISFASHLVSCIHSNTSDYELLGEFEAGLLLLIFNLNFSLIYNSMILCKLYVIVN